MADMVILASGNGSNFQSIAEYFNSSKHRVSCLICDRKDAFVIERALRLKIPYHYISYFNKDKLEAEKEMKGIIEKYNPKFIVLAGFMRLLTPFFIDSFYGRIINIHPSLLPKYPGTHGIKESFDSGDKELGITIHKVDYGMDTGPIVFQKTFRRTGSETIEEIEEKIHKLEHEYYPKVLENLLEEKNEK